MNKIHASHIWVSMLVILGAFIDCRYRSDFQMGASTLREIFNRMQGIHYSSIGENLVNFFILIDLPEQYYTKSVFSVTWYIVLPR
jgi:hypothetical protein